MRRFWRSRFDLFGKARMGGATRPQLATAHCVRSALAWRCFILKRRASLNTDGLVAPPIRAFPVFSLQEPKLKPAVLARLNLLNAPSI